jgi:hypothetical protein
VKIRLPSRRLAKAGVNPWLNVSGSIAAGLIVVAFCFLLLWHDPLVFWNDDYELSILPVFADVARSWSEGHLPLLSPYSWVCSNLAGEFQYGTFSLFVNAAVILIWKFPLTFPQQAAALSITHLGVLAAGAFLLAHDRRLSFPLSIFVALVATLNGWIICWGASDWFGALGAFAWLPWAWWGAERALDRQRTRWRFLWPAPFVYLVVTGGFPYTILMLALLIAWLACRAVALREGGSIKTLGKTKNILSILPLTIGVALGVGLAAPAWLAILDYVQGSGREVQSASEHWQWLVPLAALPAFILPCWTINWVNFSGRLMPHTATEMACGLVAPAALVAGLFSHGRELVRQIKWELGLLLVALIIAMLPSANVFRWSFRWLPFVHLVLVICAAEALRAISTAQDRHGIFASPARLALALVALIAILMSILHVGGTHEFPLIWILLGLAAAWAAADFFSDRNSLVREWTPAFITFAALLATYFCIPPNCGVPKFNLDQKLIEAAPLDPQRLYLSLYPSPEIAYRVETRRQPIGQTVHPGSTSMWAGLHFINGYSPILAAGVAREFKFAIHGEIDWRVGKYLAEQQSGADGELAKLGVDGLVIAPEMGWFDPRPASEWQLVASTSEGRVFHRKGEPFARVRSVAAIDSRPDEEFALAEISQINDSRNRLEVNVDAPAGDRAALLTFSRPYFRGYEVWLGKRKLVVDSYRGLFPIIEVPAGSRDRLVLVYRPPWLVYGGGLSILSVIVFLAGVVAAAVSGGRTRV